MVLQSCTFPLIALLQIKVIIGMGGAYPVITMVTAASLKSISLCKHHVQSTAAGESNLDSLLENSSK